MKQDNLIPAGMATSKVENLRIMLKALQKHHSQKAVLLDLEIKQFKKVS